MTRDIHKNSGRRAGFGQKQKERTATRTSNPSAALASLLLLLLPIGICASGAAADASRPSAHHAVARLARTLSVTDTGHLHLVHNGGENITEEGTATGTIPGKVRAYLEIGPTVVARFTIYASAGTISGVGSGRPKGRSEEPSFSGNMAVSHGTGRYKRVHGHGGFYGTLNRVSYKMVVQTTGTLSY